MSETLRRRRWKIVEKRVEIVEREEKWKMEREAGIVGIVETFLSICGGISFFI